MAGRDDATESLDGNMRYRLVMELERTVLLQDHTYMQNLNCLYYTWLPCLKFFEISVRIVDYEKPKTFTKANRR